MDNHTSEVPQKRCTKCGNEYPATNEYFRKHKRQKDGLYSQCLKCTRAEAKSPEHLARSRAYYQRPDVQERERKRKQSPEHKAKEREYKRTPEYLERQRERDRQRASDPKRMAWQQEYNQRPEVQSRIHARNNSPEKREWSREYQRARRQKPEINQQEREYKARPEVREMYRVHTQKRRAAQRGLPHSLTTEDKRRALEYFNGCCAVCGRQLNNLLGTHRASFDHWWIPQSKGGGLTPDNIVPLCYGQDGCNNSKSNRDPIEWLTDKFGKRKAAQILKRIQDYFDSL